MKSLDTPIKRIGFLIMGLGLLLCVIAAFQIFDGYYDRRHFLENWVGSVFFSKKGFDEYPLASIGTWLTVIGLFSSYLYDSTIRKILLWVSNGNRPASEPAKTFPLHFKDAKSAFEYSCKYMNCDLSPDQVTPCLVISTSRSDKAGSFAVIDIPTGDGPKRAVASFMGTSIPSDIVGSFCAAYIGPADPSTGITPYLLCGELSLTWQDGAWGLKRRF